MSVLLLGLAAIAVGLLALAAAAPARRGGPARARGWVLLLLYVVPAGVLAAVLWLAPPEATRLRFALLGLGFRGEAGEPLAVEIAGEPTAAELWVADAAGAPEEAPPRLARLTMGAAEEVGGPAGGAANGAGGGAGEAPPTTGEAGGAAAADGEAGSGDAPPRPSGPPAAVGEPDASGLPPRAADAGGRAAEALPLLLEVFAEGAPGLLGVSTPGGQLRPVPALRLAAGDRLTAGGRTWTVALPRLGRPALVEEASGVRVPLPRRTGELPVIGLRVPILRPHPVTAATYPLAWADAVARAAEAADGTGRGAAGAAAREAAGGPAGPSDEEQGTGEAEAAPAPAAPRADAEATAAFLFFEPDTFAGGDLWLSAPPGAVEVERGGEALPPSSRVSLAPGQRLHLLSPPRWDGAEFAASGVRDRRSFRVEPGERSLALVYDTPEVHTLSFATIDELAVEPEREATAAGEAAAARRVGLSFGDWQVTDRSLYFRHAPAAVAAEAVATIALPEGLFADRFTAATPRGSRGGRYGEPLWLGGDHLAAVQLDRLRPPHLLAALALVLALLKALAARAARLPLAGAAWAAGLEGLVALRLVLGYRAYALPPARVEALELAAVGWLLVPFAFLVAALPVPGGRGGATWRSWVPALAGWALSLTWSLRVGARPAVWIAIHLAVLAVPIVRWLLAADVLPDRTRPHRLRRAGDLWRRRLVGRGGWLADPRRQRLAWALAPFAITLLRALLLLVGLRESVSPGGTRISLSLVHLPLALAIEAGYLVWLRRRAEAAGGVVPADLGPAVAMAFGLWLLPAMLVSDLGLALLHLPVLLVALVWVTAAAGVFARDGLAPEPAPRRAAAEPASTDRDAAAGVRSWRRTGRRGTGRGTAWLRGWSRPLARWGPVAALVVVLATLAAPAAAKGFVSLVPEGWRLGLESERNYLRVLAFAYPQELARVARRESEELAVMAAVMDRYTAGPLAGRGWFATEISPHLRATALREHAVAVFVAAEKGVVGAVGLLLLYAAGALAAVPLAPWRGGLRGAPDLGFGGLVTRGLGTLAALSFALSSIYMVLANYQLTLFTGKNAYLLGLDSTADLLEALLLSTLVAIAVAVARDGEAR